MVEDPYFEESGASREEWEKHDKLHIMDQEEQLEWLGAMPAAEVKRLLIEKVKEFHTSEDIYVLLMEIIS